MIELYTAPTSNGRRATIALEECGLPYRAHVVTLNGVKPEGLLRINPLGDIPAMHDPDGPAGKPVGLSQSMAILLYAAEKAGRFMPTDRVARALTMQWLMHAATDIGPTSTTVFYLENQVPDRVDSTIKFFQDRLINFLTHLNRRLGQVEYLAGELSVADLALYPSFLIRKPLAEAHGLQHMLRWAAALAARPAIARGVKAAG
jgi:GST-like protein